MINPEENLEETLEELQFTIFELDTTEPNNLTDNHIIWVNINVDDRVAEVYDSPHREIIEQAYKNKDEWIAIPDLHAFISFNYNENYLEIPKNYYINNKCELQDFKLLKRLVVSNDSTHARMYLCSDNNQDNYLHNYKITDLDNKIYDYIEKIEFPIDSSMYVKNTNVKLKKIWEYTKLHNDISYNKLHNWTIFSDDVIDIIENLYQNKINFPNTDIVLKSLFSYNSFNYHIHFKMNDIYAKMVDCNNFKNIYIIKSSYKDPDYIDYRYMDLKAYNSYDDMCAICLAEFSESYTMNSIRLECDHRFHVMCLQCVANQVLPINHKCPMCREDIMWDLYPDITPIHCSRKLKDILGTYI